MSWRFWNPIFMTEKGQSGAMTPVLRQSQEPPKGQIRHHCGQEQCKDKSSNTGNPGPISGRGLGEFQLPLQPAVDPFYNRCICPSHQILEFEQVKNVAVA